MIEQLVVAFPGLEFQGFLGAGAMGFVYRVRDRSSGETGALKVLLPELVADPTFLERFEREARTLSRLDHPNIVRVRSWGQNGGFCHLLMEHVDGANLREALRAGRFSPHQALALVGPLCDALQYAHSQGVLHRDIKPENILLDADGRAKIADFGIAKILVSTASGPEAFTLTQTGARLGTPHYMAPEQVEQPNAVDHRADIYSLGVVLYELLTGELPLGRFQAPSAKVELDSRIDDIVLRALAKERELRQQSADEVRQQVDGLSQAATTAPTPTKPSTWFPSKSLGMFQVGFVLGLGWLFLLRWNVPIAILLLVLGINAGLLWNYWNPAARSRTESDPKRRFHMGILRAAWILSLFLGMIFTKPSPLDRLLDQTVLAPYRFDLRSRHPAVASDFRPEQSILALRQAGRILIPQWSATPEGGTHPVPPTPDPLVDPWTRQSILVVDPVPGSLFPSTILAAAPPWYGRRLVLFGDGSIQSIPEKELWQRLSRQPAQGPNAQNGSTHNGTTLSDDLAESLLNAGVTVIRMPDGTLRRTWWPLGSVFALAADGVFEPMAAALGALLQGNAEPVDCDWVFTARSMAAPDAPADLYDHTAISGGGLLALLAVAAARVGDLELMLWAQERGRPMWAGRTELVLFHRRLNGNADQDWEEVRIKTTELMKLRPEARPTLTVIRHFKAYGKPALTNAMQMPWPRIP